MTLPEFTAEMTRRGCVSDGRNFCGTFQGFPFALTFMGGTGGGKTQFSVRFQFDQKVPQAQMFKQVKAGLKGLATLQRFNSNANVFFISVTVPKKVPFATAFDQLISSITSIAPTLNLTVPHLCPLCNGPDCDSYAYQGTTYVPVHAACVQEKAQTKQAKVQKNLTQGNYLSGILGALLGGIVGAIPAAVILVMFDTFNIWVLGLICALSPLCAYYGYKLLRGKMTKAVLAVVILDAIVMIFVLHYIMIYFITKFSIFQYIAAFMVPSLQGVMIKDLLMIALFMGLGVLMVSGVISRTNTHEWKEATFSAATLRPINPNAPVPPTGPAPAAQPLVTTPVSGMPTAPAAPQAAQVQPPQPYPVTTTPQPATPPSRPTASGASALPPEMRDEAPALTAEPPAGPDL